MNAEEIIRYISESEKKTPVRVYVKMKFGRQTPVIPDCRIFGTGSSIIFGDWEKIRPVLEAEAADIEDCLVENDRRNSAVPLLDYKNIRARIEPGALIREQVTIGEGAVIMMGAIINIGAVIGERTMIDMGAILGGRAEVGRDCHIGAGAVLAGVIEPASAQPVVVEDHVLIGANAVILEGVRIGRNAVIAAGSVVTADVPENAVVAGVPGRVIKERKDVAPGKTEIIDALRSL